MIFLNKSASAKAPGDSFTFILDATLVAAMAILAIITLLDSIFKWCGFLSGKQAQYSNPAHDKRGLARQCLRPVIKRFSLRPLRLCGVTAVKNKSPLFHFFPCLNQSKTSARKPLNLSLNSGSIFAAIRQLHYFINHTHSRKYLNAVKNTRLSSIGYFRRRAASYAI